MRKSFNLHGQCLIWDWIGSLAKRETITKKGWKIAQAWFLKLWKFVCGHSLIVISLVNTFKTIIWNLELTVMATFFLFICLIILAWICLRTLWSKASKREGGLSMTTPWAQSCRVYRKYTFASKNDSTCCDLHMQDKKHQYKFSK